MALANRIAAGKLLAQKLCSYAGRRDLLVLGLPRGGVPIAFEIAMALKAPMDVFVVRKLGLPGQAELAMGAVASGGVCVLNEDLIRRYGLPDSVIDQVTARELNELQRRELAYRGRAKRPEVSGKIVILADDGVATGATVRAAINALQAQQPARLIVAAPVIAADTAVELRSQVDEVVALLTPEEFSSVGEWYEDFGQTSDAEVIHLLSLAEMRLASREKADD